MNLMIGCIEVKNFFLRLIKLNADWNEFDDWMFENNNHLDYEMCYLYYC